MKMPVLQSLNTEDHGEHGRLFRPDECESHQVDGCEIRVFITPGRGAKWITALRVDIPPGYSWCPIELTNLETIGVVFDGCGRVLLGEQTQPLLDASTFYAPTGVRMRLSAHSAAGMTVYVWCAELPSSRQLSHHPRFISNLSDNTTSCRLVAGEGDPSDSALGQFPASESEPLDPATMHFLHWPGTGSPLLGLHCGIQKPRQTFPIHRHPHSEELFIGFRGEGECYLNGTWQPMRAGDVLFAPPGLFHGARNAKHGGDPFITCGGPTPFDPVLYRLAGFSPDVL